MCSLVRLQRPELGIVTAVTREGAGLGPAEGATRRPAGRFRRSLVLCSCRSCRGPPDGEEPDQCGGRGPVPVIIMGRQSRGCRSSRAWAAAGSFLLLLLANPAMWFRTPGRVCGESESSLGLRSWLRGSGRRGAHGVAGAGWRGLPPRAVAWPVPSAPLRRWRPRLSRGLSSPPGPVGSTGQGCSCPCPVGRGSPWPRGCARGPWGEDGASTVAGRRPRRQQMLLGVCPREDPAPGPSCGQQTAAAWTACPPWSRTHVPGLTK